MPGCLNPNNDFRVRCCGLNNNSACPLLNFLGPPRYTNHGLTPLELPSTIGISDTGYWATIVAALVHAIVTPFTAKLTV